MTSSGSELADDPVFEAASRWCVRLADGLDAGEQAEFDAWMNAAPEHRDALQRAVLAWKAIDDFAATPELVSMRTEALQLGRKARDARWRRGVPRRGAVMGLAAAGLAVLAIGAGVWGGTRARSIETGVGERQVVVLADGSKVSLDAATLVKVRYSHDQRRLWLEHGRAKFEVAKDALRPFSVAAEGRVVVATGTQFSVEILRRQVRVVLYEGHVAVLDRRDPKRFDAPLRVGPRQFADQALTPGHELTAGSDPKAVTVAAVDPVRTLSWEGGQLVFDDEPLAAAVERVNRYSEHKVGLADAATGQVRVSGVFNAGDTEAFVDGITSLFHVRAWTGADGVVRIAAEPRQPIRGGAGEAAGR